MRKLLAANKSDLALVIGNGINRFGATSGTNSWDALLTSLARTHLDPDYACVPRGVSPTEFYDVLELKVRSSGGASSLQAEFCELMSTWSALPQHTWITEWAKQWKTPVLTTNFESTLSKAARLKRSHFVGTKFTAFYPWSTYYGSKHPFDPLADFAIWHINGMQDYRQSIRLGLSHYMGSVERARNWIHKSGNRLFGAADVKSWPGATTWLQVFMHKPLLFFGLGLGENEVFLRWLLIERARYFSKFPSRFKSGWYVYVEGSNDFDAGKKLFLEGVGIEPVAVANHAEVYGQSAWL